MRSMIPTAVPTLIVRQQEAQDRKIFWDRPALTIGRDSTSDIVINHPLASRRHARLEYDGTAWSVRDLESTNGTFLNGERLQGTMLLHNNDEVWVADTVIIFQDPEATMKGTPPPVVRHRLMHPNEELVVD